MNVLLFSRICAQTGVGNHIKELAEELHKIGHKVIVVSGTNEIGIPENWFVQIPIPSLNPFVLLKDIKKIHKIISKEKINVVHCHHRMAALYMRLYRVFWKIPVVYTLHLANIPSDFLHRTMTFSGDRAIGVSTEASSFIVDKLGIPQSKVVTILNGVDEKKLIPLSLQEKTELREKWNLPDGTIVLAMHCRIDEVKNHMVVVEALKHLPDSIRNNFVVVCSGSKEGTYYHNLVEEIHEYQLDSLFRFVGWSETRKVLGIADFLVLPSRNEGFALSVCEAFLLKVPVMRTCTAGFSDQKYCYPIDSDDTAPIETILSDIAINGLSGYKKQISEAYDFAISNLTVHKMTEKTLEVYMSVLDQ